MKKIKNAEHLAQGGQFEQALVQISEIDLSQMSKIEKATVQSLVNKKTTSWQTNYEKNNFAQPIKKAQVQRKLSLDEQWSSAVNLYKNNKKEASCVLIKKIFLSNDVSFRQKAKSFFDRRCAL